MIDCVYFWNLLNLDTRNFKYVKQYKTKIVDLKAIAHLDQFSQNDSEYFHRSENNKICDILEILNILIYILYTVLVQYVL